MNSFVLPKFEQIGGLQYPLGTDVNNIDSIGGVTWGFHCHEVVSALDPSGEVHSALVGVLGAAKYILSTESLEPMFDEGYSSYDVRDGILYGVSGQTEISLGNWPPVNNNE